jgi:hypothetical protein
VNIRSLASLAFLWLGASSAEVCVGEPLTVTPHMAATTQPADAELPAGVTLDWDKTDIVMMNAKRA